MWLWRPAAVPVGGERDAQPKERRPVSGTANARAMNRAELISIVTQ